MPTYEFLNTRTKKIEEHAMSIKDYETFKETNKHLERYFGTAPSFSYASAGDNISKTDNTWKEVLSKIGEQNPISPLADRFRTKGIKEVKTHQVLEKHKKLQKEKRAARKPK